MNSKLRSVLISFSKTDRIGITLMRIAIAVVFFWIGGLKFVPYEADSITPFIANSPVMSFLYAHPEGYKAHLTHEGELVPAKRDWQMTNHTYSASQGLGLVELVIGLLVLSFPFSKRLGLVGAALAFLTTLVTLSFLITTPEAWVAPLGDAQHGFPYLSGAGRLVLKDTMMLAGAWIIGVDAAKRIVASTAARPPAI